MRTLALLGFSLTAVAAVFAGFVNRTYGSMHCLEASQTATGAEDGYEYRLLATSKTSTMEKELNEAATEGFRFQAIMGGETALGGSEAVSVMSRPLGAETRLRYKYRLLATSKTSTMEKELQEAANQGFEYRDQTVFQSRFGGKEVVVILECDLEAPLRLYTYRLQATKRTSTMEKELTEAGREGFEFVGMTVAETAFAGSEVVCILRRPVGQ